MLKLVRYAKPYSVAVMVAVALLFLQANADLALPDYMSRIVNVGIQQGGIEKAVPEVLGAAVFEAIIGFMGSEAAEPIARLYEPVDPDPGKYSLAGDEGIYVLKDGADPSSVEGFDTFTYALIGAGFMGSDGARGTQAPPAMMEAMSQDPKVLEQMAIQAVRTEYERIGVDLASVRTRYILGNGLVMLGLTLLSAAATIVVGFIGARVSAGLARTLRGDVFAKVQGFTGAEFDSFSTASLITRTTNDVTQVQTVVFILIRMVVYAPILGVGGVIRALGKAPSMAWLIGLAVLILMGLVTVVMVIALPKFKAIQKLVDRLNLVARENLSGLLVVRAFNRQKFELKRFDKANVDLTGTNLFVTRVMVTMMPAIMLVMNLLTVAIIWVGARQVAASSMQVGDMMAFLQYAMQIVMSFLMLSMVFIFLPRASVSAERINDVLRTEPSVKDPESPKDPAADGPGRIEFKNVSFRYPGGEEDALQGIDFTVEPGQTTAIIGATGSGKSTVMNLIPRFYDVTGGSILLDGTDVREMSQAALRDRIGYVPQKNTLFSGTIESNLRYADEGAGDEEILAAAEIAQAADIIAEKEEGMASPISQGGTNVSGGQKQRLSIARALVKKSPVLLFDDSFSALDFRTDAALRKALKEASGTSAVIIVAQRVSTIMKSEQIIVLDEGRIVGKGTHGDLMATCEPYREIALSQLSMKELA